VSTPTVNFTYAGNEGTRTIQTVTTGSTANNAINFNFTAGNDIANIASAGINDLNFTGFTGTATNQARNLYGNLILGTGMTAAAGANAVTFNGVSANQTLVTNGVATDFPINISSTNGNFILGENLNIVARALTVDSSNLIANGYGITAGTFDSNNANTRIINISNITVDLTAAGTVWNMATATGANLIAANSNINLTSDSTSTRLFAGGGFTYGNLDIGGSGANALMTFTGNNTFAGTLTSSKTAPHTVQFTAGTTTTVGGFDISGTEGNVVTITSASQAQHNLVLTGGGNVDTVDYLNIRYSNASPAVDTWYPGLNSINSGDNTGWMFPAPPPGGSSSNFFLVF
jgi:hypothetical protein